MTATSERDAYLTRLGLEPEPPSVDFLFQIHPARVHRRVRPPSSRPVDVTDSGFRVHAAHLAWDAAGRPEPGTMLGYPEARMPTMSPVCSALPAIPH